MGGLSFSCAKFEFLYQRDRYTFGYSGLPAYYLSLFFIFQTVKDGIIAEYTDSSNGKI